MRKNFWNKKIPTLLGLIVITLGTVLTTFLVKGESIFQIRAGPGQTPKNIQITNISDSSFTVSYITQDKVIGTITYGTSADLQNSVSLDDRDQLSQSIAEYNVHSITANNLKPNTSYFFTITSGDEKFLKEGIAFQVTSGSRIDESPSSQVPVSGKVVLPDGTVPSEGLVYVKTTGSQKLSGLIKSDGNYIVPLNTLRNSSFNKYLKIDDLISIEVFSKDLFSKATVSKDDISPVPLITISSNYDFSPNEDFSNSGVESAEAPGFPKFEEASQKDGEPAILTPKIGEQLSESQPTFEGIAQPNEIVEIEIHSDENIQTQVTADASGNWTFTPPKDLSPGEHTITITTKNKNGILKTITQKFIVFAAEISPSPTTTPIPRLTTEPIQEPISTVEPTIIPTLPPTGNSSVIIAAVAVIAAASFAVMLFFLNRSQSL